MMAKYNNAPLKRHAALIPLSRDHYVGLVQGRRLLQAADGNAVDRRGAVATFIDVWETELGAHFDDEERLLAPLADEAGRRRMLEEHAVIRGMVAEAREHRRQVDPGEAWTRHVGRYLTDHIRWEERELFPAIEASAGAELEAMKPEADRIEASRPRGRGKR